MANKPLTGNSNSLLPRPTAADRLASDGLYQRVVAAIARNGGGLPFAEYMRMALYDPEFGYYTGGQQQFGAAGDFVTAAEISPMFGQCVATQAAELLEHCDSRTLVELGAGTGSLAAQVLGSEALRGRLDRYQILELSPGLRERQRRTLADRPSGLGVSVQWIDRLPDAGFGGVVIANEVLDAMPVDRVRVTGGQAWELQVTHRDGKLRDEPRAVAEPRLTSRIAQLRLPDDYSTEIGLQAEAWVATFGRLLGAGALMIVDYGFPRAEFYHPQRSMGTLMCHYRHWAHADPYHLPGLQDITAHLDFTAIAEAGLAAGLDLLGYTNQANFLLDTGIAQLLEAEQGLPEMQYLALAQGVKRLLMPQEMGELFKVMVLGRGIPDRLRGFQTGDARHRL